MEQKHICLITKNNNNFVFACLFFRFITNNFNLFSLNLAIANTFYFMYKKQTNLSDQKETVNLWKDLKVQKI